MAKFIPRAQSYTANIDRARHNLYEERSTTLHPLTAIPIYYRRMMRGDDFNFGVMESILRSNPTFAPLLANWRLEFQWYFDSDANRYGWIDNNTRLTSDEVMNRIHHCVTPFKRILYSQSNSFDPRADGVGMHSIAEYSGVAAGSAFYIPDGGFDTSFGFWRNIDFHLTYLNIIRNYHINKQFPNIPYIANRPAEFSPYTDTYTFETYSLDKLDKLFMFLRSCPNGVKFNSNSEPIESEELVEVDAPDSLVEYYGDAVRQFVKYLQVTENYCGGLFCTQFEPDLYQNLLANDQNLLRSLVTIQNIAGQQGITIEQFRLKNHLQGLYDKIFVSGGADRELSRTLWGIESNRDYDIPELLCVHSEIIGTNIVTSSTAGQTQVNGENVNNVSGSMSGNINTRRGAGRSQRFKAKTAGSLMCIVTLTPLVSYSQNIERHLLENNFMDEFTPDMARKGFESVPLSDYTVLPTLYEDGVPYETQYPLSQVVGKQVAWLREMTAVNRVYGEFTEFGTEADWVLRRSYMKFDATEDIVKPEISVYGNPLSYQYPFVSQTIYDPNFQLQVAIKCVANRPVPRRIMPNLGY